MKSYWDLNAEQRAEVDRDPVVLAAAILARAADAASDVAALDALAALAALDSLAYTAAAAALAAYTSARAEATARMFGKEEVK